MNSKEYIEKRNTTIVDMMYQIVNASMKNNELGKLEFYGGCFARDVAFDDVEIVDEKLKDFNFAVEDNQLYRWIEKKNILSFQNKYKFVIAAQTKWLRELIKEKTVYTYELETEIKHRLSELLPDVFQKKITLDGYSIEQLISINLIHDYCNTIKKQKSYPSICSFCESDNELEQFKKLLANKNNVLISGMPLTGKTELALSYMKKEDFLYTYYDYTEYRSPEKIEQVISVEEEELLAEVSELFSIGQELSLNDYLKIANPCQKQAIVIDNYDGTGKELEQIFKIVEGTPVCMIVITQKKFSGVIEQMKLGRLSKQSAIENFFNINAKEKDKEEDVIKEIAEKVFDQTWLLLLIAQWYKAYREKDSDNALAALEELNSEMDNILTVKLSKDIKFRFYPSSEELKLVGHIRKVTAKYLTTVESNTYMLLACLAGVRVSEKYLKKWLNINPVQLAELNEAGWCDICRDDMESGIRFKIPTLIAVACNNITERKSDSACDVLNQFMENFSREIRYEECGEINDADIRRIITHLHRYCASSMEYRKGKKQKEIILKFHLDCIRYYLMMCDYNAANELYDTWKTSLGIDENNITIRVLKAYQGIVQGNTQALASVEDDYLKPIEESNKQFGEEIYRELQEVLIIVLNVFWSNYEGMILFLRKSGINYTRMCWNIIENYTKILKITSSKCKEAGMNSMNHYWAIFQMEKRVNNIFADDYNAFYSLQGMFESVQNKKSHSRMRNMDELRFLFDFQFVLLRCISFVPVYNKEYFIKLYDSVKVEIFNRFNDSNKYLPDDIMAKATILFEYAMSMGR